MRSADHPWRFPLSIWEKQQAFTNTPEGKYLLDGLHKDLKLSLHILLAIGSANKVIKNTGFAFLSTYLLNVTTQCCGQLSGQNGRNQEDDQCKEIRKFRHSQAVEGRDKEKIEGEKGSESGQ